MRYKTHTEAWTGELFETLYLGDRVAPRGLPTHERTFGQFVVEDPMSFPLNVIGREFRDAIGVLEGLSMIGQFSVPESLTRRVKNFGNFTDDGIFWGAYGTRLHGQVGDLVRRLALDPESRQCVLTIFDGGRDLAAVKRDIPCTVSVQFLIRDGYLDMRVTMRSNDLWLGLPYDLVQFSILQATIAQMLNVAPGRYYHAAGSLHLYDKDRDVAVKIVSSPIESMPFPLWSVTSMSNITSAARSMALRPEEYDPKTRFEEWACTVLS